TGCDGRGGGRGVRGRDDSGSARLVAADDSEYYAAGRAVGGCGVAEASGEQREAGGGAGVCGGRRRTSVDLGDACGVVVRGREAVEPCDADAPAVLRDGEDGPVD